MVVKPFLKWAGGKTQLLNILRNNYPSGKTKYAEPFVGGGAVLFVAPTVPRAFSVWRGSGHVPAYHTAVSPGGCVGTCLVPAHRRKGTREGATQRDSAAAGSFAAGDGLGVVPCLGRFDRTVEYCQFPVSRLWADGDRNAGAVYRDYGHGGDVRAGEGPFRGPPLAGGVYPEPDRGRIGYLPLEDDDPHVL